MDLDIPALQAKGLSPNDVVNAIGTQNLILPAGTVKIGTLENDVDLNGEPEDRRGTERPADQDGRHEHDLCS